MSPAMSVADATSGNAVVGGKLAGLLVTSVAVVWLNQPLISLSVAAVGVTLARLGGANWRVIRRFGSPILMAVAFIVAIHLVLRDPDQAAQVGSRLGAVGMLAIAFTLTTRSTDIVAWVERVLTRLRVRPTTVFRVGLVSGLTTRSFEHLGVVATRVLDARRSRGLQRSARAFAVPMVVEAARLAHGMGEALEARGIGEGGDAEAATEAQPYRMIHTVTPAGPNTGHATWVPSGNELGPSTEPPALAPPHLVAEAMAQTAGMLLAATSPWPERRWALAGIDAMVVGTVRWGVPVHVTCTVDRMSERASRVVAVAAQADGEPARATLMLVPFVPAATTPG